MLINFVKEYLVKYCVKHKKYICLFHNSVEKVSLDNIKVLVSNNFLNLAKYFFLHDIFKVKNYLRDISVVRENIFILKQIRETLFNSNSKTQCIELESFSAVKEKVTIYFLFNPILVYKKLYSLYSDYYSVGIQNITYPSDIEKKLIPYRRTKNNVLVNVFTKNISVISLSDMVYNFLQKMIESSNCHFAMMCLRKNVNIVNFLLSINIYCTNSEDTFKLYSKKLNNKCYNMSEIYLPYSMDNFYLSNFILLSNEEYEITMKYNFCPDSFFELFK